MKLLYSLILFLLLYAFSFSQNNTYINHTYIFNESELNGVETTFFPMLYKSQSQMSYHAYYDAFLIASGITDKKEFISYKIKLNIIRQNARTYLTKYIKLGNVEVVGEKLLAWLHENVFIKYETNATLASHILDNGTYNCLSSSVLYGLLLKEFGLKAKGVFVPNHAYIKLIINDDKEINIETTNPYGFNASVSEYSNKTDVSISTLIANIYQNSIGLLGYYSNDNDYDTIRKKMHYISPQYYLY